MTRKYVMSTMLGIAMLMICSVISVSAQKVDCTAVSDDQLVRTVMAKVAEKYADQMDHINIRSKDRVVTIEGWVTTKKVRSDIAKMVKRVACVKKVSMKLTIGVGGGCSRGTKQCGTICIPIDETCNIGAPKID